MTQLPVAVVHLRIAADDAVAAVGRLAQAAGAAGATIERIAVAEHDDDPDQATASVDYDRGGW